MRSIGQPVSRARQTVGLGGGSCLLLLYLVSATPLAPAVFSLLAGLDRSHHVALQQSTQGLQVVLRHDCPESTSHRHGVIARALTVFAQRSTAPQADHVIQFGAMDTAQQAPAPAIEPTSEPMERDDSLACAFGFGAADVNLPPAAFPRPPPAASGLLLTIRSTVLLI